MNMLEEMRDARDTSGAVFMEFSQDESQLISEGKKVIFFLEGKDDINYYRKRFDKYLEKEYYHYYKVKGKEYVLKLRRKLENISELKLFYFIDKDFDNIHSEIDVYVTPCYSIENLYISKKVFGKYLNEIFISKYREKEEYEKILNLYIERKNEFLEALDELMEFYFYNHKLNKNLGNLSDLDKLIIVKLDKIDKKYDRIKLQELAPEAEKDMNDFKILAEFNEIKKDKINFYRGKFLFYFLKEFITQLRVDYTSKNPKYFLHRRTLKNINTQELLFEMADWSETPKSLDKFLENIKIS